MRSQLPFTNCISAHAVLKNKTCVRTCSKPVYSIGIEREKEDVVKEKEKKKFDAVQDSSELEYY